jgi:hypothetical protein
MASKPNRATGYERHQVDHVRATCLYVATKLGDLVDETVIVGGLVPSLLVDQRLVQTVEARHVGTMDLDVGLALAILDDQRYQALTERLRQAGFTQDENEQGQPTRQRHSWHHRYSWRPQRPPLLYHPPPRRHAPQYCLRLACSLATVRSVAVLPGRADPADR